MSYVWVYIFKAVVWIFPSPYIAAASLTGDDSFETIDFPAGSPATPTTTPEITLLPAHETPDATSSTPVTPTTLESTENEVCIWHLYHLSSHFNFLIVYAYDWAM